jgi:putative oxidoreductase
MRPPHSFPSRLLVDGAFGTPSWLGIPSGLLLAGIRCHLAWVFLAAGLIKAQGFDTTLALFEGEYAVPLLGPHAAAWLATGIELSMPPLLAFGLLVRPAALVLCAFNCVAAVSYPDLSDSGARDHVYWGVLLLFLALHGGGVIALDRLVLRRLATTSARERR